LPPKASRDAMNLAELIFQRTQADSVAVIDHQISYSYGFLAEKSAEIAARLLGIHAVGRAARIGLKCRDGFSYIALSLGILRANACFVPIAPELSKAECQSLIELLHLDGVITEGEDLGEFSYEVTPHGAGCPWQVPFEGLNPALIRFSSGTTGTSKGIVLSHETLLARIIAANDGLQIGPQDRVLWVLSMAHHFAVSILLYLWNGAAILIPEAHLATDFLTTARDHGATVLYGAPFHYLLLISSEEKIPWPSLRLAVSTTAGLAPQVAADFLAKYGLHPVQALGVMEVGLPFLNISEPEKRPTSIGRPQPAFEARLLTSEGQQVLPGEEGELFLKGPGIFDAYISPWKIRGELLRNGEWFATGDIARADEEGFYYLLGRTKAVINVGGMKFFPEEVENLLCSHPGVSDARVMGRVHPTFGSVPVAEIVPTGNPQVSASELTMLCKKQLARYKIPVEMLFVDAIPKTPSGKTLRR